MRRALGGLCLLACSAAPVPEPVPSPPPPPPASVSSPAPSPAATALPTASAAVPDPPPQLEGPRACPESMILVVGDYCTEVEHDCLRSWYDKSNKKTVCEEFKPTARCVGRRVAKRFCIDTYSWPNVKGERPEVMNNFYQAQVKCAAVGKRMCTESEWTFACEGPEMKPFPYGYVRDPKKCNGDHEWDGPDMTAVAQRDPAELARLWRGVRNGAQPGCVSDFGVPDLPGNTDDVVASEAVDGSFGKKFSAVNTGGPWYKGTRNQCRPKIYTHDEGFYYYFLGFRCCAEPDGRPSEARTPLQVRQKWSWDRIERLAQFTVRDVTDKLELKARQGHCDCDVVRGDHRRMICNTICGTLLGPGAQDAW